MDPWKLTWEGAWEDQTYAPLYLANGVFGGQLNASGTDITLWSASHGSVNREATEHPEVRYPLALTRLAVFYRNAYFKERGFWIGRDGILSSDTRYKSDPSMPHRPQVYDFIQALDLRTGLAETTGCVYPGSRSGLHADQGSERVLRFHARMAFLKDSPALHLEVTTDPEVEIALRPHMISEEIMRLQSTAPGISALGSAIDCHLSLHQKAECVEAGDERLVYRMTPEGGEPVEIMMQSTATRGDAVNGEPALIATDRLAVTVLFRPIARPRPVVPESTAAFFAAQAQRWNAFWERSQVSLPKDEALWQQRYHASLFYVAQSIGEGPTHPGGLSKPNYPHWFGCFHDTDTYFCRPLLETGRNAEAGLHLDYRYRTLDRAKAFAQELGSAGALYPWQTDMAGCGEGRPCPINSAIIAVEAFLQFQYSRDLEAKAKAREIVQATLAYLATFVEDGSQGFQMQDEPILTFSETVEAVAPSEAVLGIRATAAALLALSPEEAEAALARRLLEELTVPRLPDGSYAFTPAGDLEYLRCPSVSLGSFPLHHLPADEALAQTFRRELTQIVHLFAWLPHQASVVASQLRETEGPGSAHQLLRDADVFYGPWQSYDEWENRRTGRAEHFVTAAGGFATALHHFLIAETAPQRWGLFPGTPSGWQDVGFEGLVTRAGWRVSCRLEAGVLRELHAEPVSAHADAVFTLELDARFTVDPSLKGQLEAGEAGQVFRFQA